MDDPSDSPSDYPYLVHDPDPDTETSALPDLDELLPEARSSVLLNHGDAEAFGNAVSLGTALRSALAGQARSFTALVGFLGGQYGDEEVPADDPTEILGKELEDGLSGEDRTRGHEVGFRLAFGGVSSKVPEIALQAWYWICRWHHPEYGNGSGAEDWRCRVLEDLESRPHDEIDYGTVLLPVPENPIWSKQHPPEVGFGAPKGTDRQTELAIWEAFLDELEGADEELLETAGQLVAYMLQRSADVRVQPWPDVGVESGGADESELDEGLLHAKLYVVERGELGGESTATETVAFAGSNNWSRAALAGLPEPDGDWAARKQYRNIEVSVADRSRGAVWPGEPDGSLGVSDQGADGGGAESPGLGARIGRTARQIFGELPVLGSWTTEYEVLDAALVRKLCDADESPWKLYDHEKISEDEIPDRRTQLLADLHSIIEKLVDLDIDGAASGVYQDTLTNKPSKLDRNFLKRLKAGIENLESFEVSESLEKLLEYESGEWSRCVDEHNPLFGGLRPAHYQVDGALRLMGMLDPDRAGNRYPRGAFLTDEAGLGKTLVAEMTSAFLIAEKLYKRVERDEVTNNPDARRDLPLRVSLLVPARLTGEPGDASQAPSGWWSHANRLRQAAAWAFGRRLHEGEQGDLSTHFGYIDAVDVEVFSHSSLSRALEDGLESTLARSEPALSGLDPDDFGPEHGPLPEEAYNKSVADDLYHVATSEVVVIDESHNFRNDTSRQTRTLRYALSLPIPGEEDWSFEIPDGTGGEENSAPVRRQELASGRRVLCLSATPFNNEVDDIVTQIGHFDQFQDWTKPFQSRQEKLFRNTEELSDALRDWKSADPRGLSREGEAPSTGVEGEFRSPRPQFDVITRYIWHHLESGRSLRMAEDQRDESERAGEDVTRDRYTDGGPEYEWSDRAFDHEEHETSGGAVNYYTKTFAPAVEWAREQKKNESTGELAPEYRNEIDALLSELMVQRSRIRVIDNVEARATTSTNERDVEDVEGMFRKPRVPRYPLELNDPPEGDEVFEGRVVERLGALFAKQHDLQVKESEGRTSPALELFSYEVSIRRDRENAVSQGETQTAVNAVGFQTLNLIKRLQSSPYAFMRSITRGPLRRAMREIAVFEAFVTESLVSPEHGIGWAEQGIEWVQEPEDAYFDDRPPSLPDDLERLLADAAAGAKRLRIDARPELDDEVIEGNRTLKEYAPFLNEVEEKPEKGDFIGENAGYFVDRSNSERLGDRSFQDEVDAFREGLVEVAENWPSESDPVERPQHSWLVDHLDDFARIADEDVECTESQLWRDVVTSVQWLEKGLEGDSGILDALFGGLPRPGDKLRSFHLVRKQYLEWLSVDLRDDGRIEGDELERGVNWIVDRLRDDERLRSLVGWLLLQTIARLHSDAGEAEPVDGDALHDMLPAGPRTLLFTEYADTQEYLVACLTAVVASLNLPGADVPEVALERIEGEGRPLEALRAIFIGSSDSDDDGVIREVAERLLKPARRRELHNRGWKPPVRPEPDVHDWDNDNWLTRWLEEARAQIANPDDPLRRVGRELFGATARICSDVSERINDGGEIDRKITDDDARIEGEQSAEAVMGDVNSTDTLGDPVDAFSPWYQIEPEPGEDSEKHAERLRAAAASPVYTLISTEVLAEGVNLQECGFIAHYDLPWNPTNLIQRNGRIDRRLNPVFEEPDRREALAEELGLDPSERPGFARPRQVYHSTVVPVEPEVGNRPAYTEKVRETLFRKLSTIRALFGLSSWPVVLDRDEARKVLTGELEYETPGFRRREDLHNAKSKIESQVEGIDETRGDGGARDYAVPVERSFARHLLRDVSGWSTSDIEAAIEGESAPGDTDEDTLEEIRDALDAWDRVLAVCLTTWTPWRFDSVPVRSGTQLSRRIENQHLGIVQATLLIRDPDEPEQVRLVTWSGHSGGESRKQLVPASVRLENWAEPGGLETVECGGSFDFHGHYASLEHPDRKLAEVDSRSPLEPRSPSAFAEDVLVNAVDAVLAEGEGESGSSTESMCAGEIDRNLAARDSPPELAEGLRVFASCLSRDAADDEVKLDGESLVRTVGRLAHKFDSVDGRVGLREHRKVEDLPGRADWLDESEELSGTNLWLILRD